MQNKTIATGSVGITIGSSQGGNFAIGNTISGWDTSLLYNSEGVSGKYLDNLTDNCNTPFSGGTPVNGNN